MLRLLTSRLPSISTRLIKTSITTRTRTYRYPCICRTFTTTPTSTTTTTSTETTTSTDTDKTTTTTEGEETDKKEDTEAKTIDDDEDEEDDDDDDDEQRDEDDDEAMDIPEYNEMEEIRNSARPSPSRPGYVIVSADIGEGEEQDIEIKEDDLKTDEALDAAITLAYEEHIAKNPEKEEDDDDDDKKDFEKTEDITPEQAQKEIKNLKREIARLELQIEEEEEEPSPDREHIRELEGLQNFWYTRIVFLENNAFNELNDDEMKSLTDWVTENNERDDEILRSLYDTAIAKYSTHIKANVVKKLAAQHPDAFPLAAALAQNEVIEWYTDKEEEQMIRARPGRRLKPVTYEAVAEDIPAITSFLKTIKLEKHVDKFPSWLALMSMKTLEMKKAQIGCKDRKKILKWVEFHKRERWLDYQAQQIRASAATTETEHDSYRRAREQERQQQQQEIEKIRQHNIDLLAAQQPLREQVMGVATTSTMSYKQPKLTKQEKQQAYIERKKKQFASTTTSSSQAHQTSFEKTW